MVYFPYACAPPNKGTARAGGSGFRLRAVFEDQCTSLHSPIPERPKKTIQRKVRLWMMAKAVPTGASMIMIARSAMMNAARSKRVASRGSIAVTLPAR